MSRQSGLSIKSTLHNPADRDHCLQYITAIGLLFGDITADHYEEETASDPRIDTLRSKMEVTEHKAYSKDYLDPNKRSISNAVQVHFTDGTATDGLNVNTRSDTGSAEKKPIRRFLPSFQQTSALIFIEAAAKIEECEHSECRSSALVNLWTYFSYKIGG